MVSVSERAEPRSIERVRGRRVRIPSMCYILSVQPVAFDRHYDNKTECPRYYGTRSFFVNQTGVISDMIPDIFFKVHDKRVKRWDDPQRT